MNHPSESIANAAGATPRPARLPGISGEAWPARDTSLISQLVTWWNHRWLIFASVAICTALGVIAAVLLPRSYGFTTTIEIGQVQLQGGGSALIEPTEAVIAKITNAFLPQIERAYEERNGRTGFTIGMDVRSPRGTSLLLLSSKGSQAQQEEHISIHSLIVQRVVEEHRREVELMRTNLGQELDQAKRAAAATKEQATTLFLRRKLLDEKRTIMDQRMRDIEKELMVVTANREMASKSVSGQEQVLTLMMLDLQLSRERDKRDELRQEYTLGLAEEADRLVRDEANLQRTLQDREGAIAMIEARIVHLSETRRVNEPLRSQKPVGIGRATIVILAVIIGLMIGLLLVWLRQGLHEHRMTVATT